MSSRFRFAAIAAAVVIAATALANHLTLVSANTREFVRVTGLALENWELAD